MLRLLAPAALLIAFLAPPAEADGCMRHVGSTDHGGPDGPGSFGPLQDTLTLGCLKFIRVLGEPEQPRALLLDESGKEYVVEVGSYIGENTGRITSITSKRIRIAQLVKNEDGEYVEAVRFVFLTPS